jgi:signal peptidase I
MRASDITKPVRIRLRAARKRLSRARREFGWRRLVAAVKEPCAVAGLVLVSTTAIAQPFYVPSGSMEPTLQIGDGLIATKFDYGYSRYSVPFAFGPASATRLLQKMPARGDIVLFRMPNKPSETLVKRLIGLPGDRIQMQGGRLWINGALLPLRAAGTTNAEWHDGSPIRVGKFIETLPGGRKHPIFKQGWNGPLDDTRLFTVPAGHLFMMGDNRDDSTDSRVDPADGGVGYVPIENVVGRARIVVGSVDFLHAPSLLGWPAQTRLGRFLTGVR